MQKIQLKPTRDHGPRARKLPAETVHRVSGPGHALSLQRSLGNAGVAAVTGRIQRTPREPYVKRINVDLNGPQNVTVEWQGTPPDEVRSSFRCSTGKGYGDPGDPPGICNRSCCNAGGGNPCAAPNDEPSARGSCCTPVGDFKIRSREREHAVIGGTIPFWMYFLPRRGIALHEYRPVDGTPISHGCVRLDSVNAEMLYTYSVVGVTDVHVSGTATPTCPAGNGVACGTSASATGTSDDGRLAGGEQEEVDRSA